MTSRRVSLEVVVDDADEQPSRRCYICNCEMPAVSGLALGWESEPSNFTPWRKQYRCPRHRRDRPALATVGDIIDARRKLRATREKDETR